MEIVADLHLHSKYSRAVSPRMVVSEIARWAVKKGIDLVGTGDWTHPLWLRELKECLDEGEGILVEKDPPSLKFRRTSQKDKGYQGSQKNVRFLLTAEISSIYSQGGKVRKIHNIIIAPSFSVVEKINQELKNRGANLMADGRPTVGMSAKDLLQLVMAADENCLVIPAHAWTPWFSLYGSKSGFDSIKECFGDLSKHIFAIETGLSSDPGMNWRVADLNDKSIVSFSDAHSPQNLGREATVFEVKDIKRLRYEDIRRAIEGEFGGIGVGEGIKYTVEFYPEEGKYHYTGHRNCGIVYGPEDIAKKGEICPICGKKLTIGVVERVRQLGELDGPEGSEEKDERGITWVRKEGRPPFVKLVPLAEIIAESFGVGDKSKKVINEYNKLVESLGSEFKILMKLKLEEIAKVGGEKIAEGIMKVRRGDICIRPGFDGEYGKVGIWGDEEIRGVKGEANGQIGLFN